MAGTTTTITTRTRQRWMTTVLLIAVGLGIALPLPSTAEAKSGAKGPKKKGVSDVVHAINGPDSNVGMVVLLHYDGTIETIGVNRDGTEVESYDAPPPSKTVLGQQIGVDFEIYEKNPKCITCKHGGSYYTICR